MAKGRVRQSKMMITVRLCISAVSTIYIQLSKQGDAWLRGQNAVVDMSRPGRLRKKVVLQTQNESEKSKMCFILR
jgi:hypothetical protein